MAYATEEELLLAAELGYEVKCDQKKGHRFTKDGFLAGNIEVWAINGGWQTAMVVNGIYRDHLPFKSLSDALRRE